MGTLVPEGNATTAPLPADSAPPTRQGPATLALVAATLTLVVIIASAYMRHVQAGLSCVDWPSCYASVGGVADGPGVVVVRGVHRLAASGVSLAVLAMLGLAFVRRTTGRAQHRFTAAALAIIAGLAVLGLATPGARLPAVALANLLGGFALLAVLAATHANARALHGVSRRFRALAIATLALALLQAALGGLIATQSALLACPGFPGCDHATWQGLVDGGGWNPFRAAIELDGKVVAPEGAATLHLIHRLNGVLLAALVLVIATRLWRPRGGLASALVLTLAPGFGAGIAAALVPSALGVTLVHNACAAVLIALLAHVAASPVAPEA